ncbi:MAG TPA: saccharopine dehydrogenase NADP-binding domain-containing protein, partial [Synergistaceae bacterium]|nr:saccharopine dehydrogenase NADP-binding domain-containing protein [Synergistaceae bacterium]
MQVVQIGAGLVGQVIVEDLLEDFDVTVVDPNPQALEKIRNKFPQVHTEVASGTDLPKLRRILEKADVATAGVPGQYGYEMMKAVIETGTSLADISFMPEDFDLLNDLAVEKGVTVVPDIGVAPGMSNFLMGRGAALLDEVDEAFIYVGGIPD